MGIHAWAIMIMEGVIYEREGEDIHHKMHIQLIKAAVELQNERHRIMGAGADNAHKVKGAWCMRWWRIIWMRLRK